MMTGCAAMPTGELSEADTSQMTQVMSFGTNPGGLRMWKYVPQAVPPNAPLVVAMHACGQQAADYVKAGWNELADKLKFYVVYPEQTTTNNSLTCFNWAGSNSNPLTGENDPANLTRGQGENQSIKQMVDQMKADYSIDATRVFVTGFSGGGAETALMLATWPDVFAAGAALAGVPYHCTTNKNEVYSPCMTPGRNLTPAQWGDYVRNAYMTFKGPWPRLAIWQGSKDSLVNPDNTQELLKQWTNVQGLSQTPTSTDMLNGNARNRFRDPSGRILVETVAVNGMDHGVSIDTKSGCGSAAQYFYDTGTCSSFYIAEFFGLTTSSDDGGAGTTTTGGTTGSTTGPTTGSTGGTTGGTTTTGTTSGGGGPSDMASGCTVLPGRPDMSTRHIYPVDGCSYATAQPSGHMMMLLFALAFFGLLRRR
jgi:poly(hydroxyalkanoate) depolymerase family esterase